MTPRWRPVRTAAFAVLLSATPAVAAPPGEEAARALFREGLALHESHEYGPALEKYREAYAHWKNPKILTNIGSAAWELGRFAEAASAYDQFLSEAPAGDPTRGEVEKALRDVLPKVGTLNVHVTGGPAAITLDGQYVEGPGFDRLRVTPGAHSVEAVQAGGARAKQTVDVPAGGAVDVSLEPGTAEAPRPATTSVGVDASGTKPPPSVLPWVVGGIGVAGLATSGILFAMRGSAVSDLHDQCLGGVCPDSSRGTIDRATQLGTWSVVALGVGVVGAGGAVFLLSTRHERSSQGGTAVHLGVSPGPAGATAVARVRF